MIIGGIPGLAIDRSGAALLGAVVLVVGGSLTTDEAWQAVDVSTICLLFGLMLVSVQLRLGGFYTRATHAIVDLDVSPRMLLGVLIAAAAILASVLTNDVICLAMTPIVIEGCLRRNLNPVPYLLALACATNIGSALTLIGNPQNILIGQTLDMPFLPYTLRAFTPVLAGLAITWAVIAFKYRHRWHVESNASHPEGAAFDLWHTVKGLAILSSVVVLVIADIIEREIVALAAAALVLLSRRIRSRDTIGLIDWHLLVLFIGLFVVNGAMSQTGLTAKGIETISANGIDLQNPSWLFGASIVLSNLVSNVPATMLLLPTSSHADAGTILALSSTLAGNLLIVGSIANIIVVEYARQVGIHISWKEHARIGVPITLASLVVAAVTIAAF